MRRIPFDSFSASSGRSLFSIAVHSCAKPDPSPLALLVRLPDRSRRPRSQLPDPLHRRSPARPEVLGLARSQPFCMRLTPAAAIPGSIFLFASSCLRIFVEPSYPPYLFTADWPRAPENYGFAAAPVARRPPLHPVPGSSAQTPERRDPPESAEILQSVPAKIRGREVLPGSTGSSSLSRFSAVPAIAPRGAHLPPHRSSRRASRIQMSSAPR